MKFDYKHIGDPGFLLAVVRGDVDGASFVAKYGVNLDVGTAYETLWTGGGIYVWMPTGSVLKISSESTDDDAGGTGALTVNLQGLEDVTYAEIDEDLILDGQTPVETVNTYIRVHRMEVLTAGSGGMNAGNLWAGTGTVAAGVPAVKHTQVLAGEGKTLQCFYTIPGSVTGYVLNSRSSSNVSKQITARMMIRPVGGIFHTIEYDVFIDGLIATPSIFPDELLEKTDIQMQAKVGITGGDIAGRFDILLIDN